MVASALGELPLGEIHGTAVRRITDLTAEGDASLQVPIELRACPVRRRDLAGGRHLVVMRCELTNQLGDCVAAFSVEVEAEAEAPAAWAELESIAAADPDLECVDNIPV